MVETPFETIIVVLCALANAARAWRIKRALSGAMASVCLMLRTGGVGLRLRRE